MPTKQEKYLEKARINEMMAMLCGLVGQVNDSEKYLKESLRCEQKANKLNRKNG